MSPELLWLNHNQYAYGISLTNSWILIETSLPYFWVKLSCVCLMFAYRKNSKRILDPTLKSRILKLLKVLKVLQVLKVLKVLKVLAVLQYFTVISL